MGVENIRDKLQKNFKIGNSEGASIWLKQALDREYLVLSTELTM